MSTLDYAALMSASGPLVILAVFPFVLRRHSERFFWSWFKAILFVSPLAIADMLMTWYKHPPALVVASTLLAGSAAWWFTRAALDAADRPPPRHGWLAVLGVVSLWDALAWIWYHNWLATTVLPIACLFASLEGLGLALLRRSRDPFWRSANLVGWALVAKGLWLLTYPIFQLVPFTWFGYWISSLIDLVMGLGMLLLLLDQASQMIESRTQLVLLSEREKVEHLEQLDKLKDNFVSATSHELRTPLTSIRGFAEFLEDEIDGPLAPEQRTYVGQIQRAAERLGNLVDDLLDFARIDSGHFVLDRRNTSLADVARAELEALRPQLAEKRLELALDLPADPVLVNVDAQRIGQVIANLLANAIKFTPSGGRVRLAVAHRSDGVRVTVGDTGIGIPVAAQARLFEKFYQVDPGITRAYGGTGLGLSISRALVEAHGGRIACESTEGEGSTFWFDLPGSGPELPGSGG